MSAPPDGQLEASRDGGPRSRVWLHVLLFALTVLTTTAAGALYVNRDSMWPLANGLPFSLPLMAILTCHELGHYLAARIHGVPASLPYFIPLPPGIGLFGTMGAVITQGGGTTDRKQLIDIGAAVPLAGLLVAIPVLYFGLQLSEVKVIQGLGFQEGNSLLYAGLKFLAKGVWLPHEGRDVALHPTALAGWGGLLVTMINLLPIGQLDGGHIATALQSDGARRPSDAPLGLPVCLRLGVPQRPAGGGRPLPARRGHPAEHRHLRRLALVHVVRHGAVAGAGLRGDRPPAGG
jgi:membrane-associated protease RseP (regulator of RpoE activity)